MIPNDNEIKSLKKVLEEILDLNEFSSPAHNEGLIKHVISKFVKEMWIITESDFKLFFEKLGMSDIKTGIESGKTWSVVTIRGEMKSQSGKSRIVAHSFFKEVK